MNDIESKFIENTHQLMVGKLVKPAEDILLSMTPEKMHLLHMASKLCSEAGELMDAIGKLCFYNKTLDRLNVAEELGDCEFYMEGIRQKLGWNREVCLNNNIDKLSKRYPNWNYTDANAQARMDKQ